MPKNEKKPEIPKVDSKKPEAPKMDKKLELPKVDSKKPDSKLENKKPDLPKVDSKKAKEKKPEVPKPESKKPTANPLSPKSRVRPQSAAPIFKTRKDSQAKLKNKILPEIQSPSSPKQGSKFTKDEYIEKVKNPLE